MKSLLLTLCLAALSTLSWAAKANSTPFAVTQSDGTRLTVVLHGDEHFSWYTTTDGVLLSRQGNDFYIASVDAQGFLSPTAQLAHEATARSMAETLAAKAQDKAAFFSEEADQQRANMRHEPLNPSSSPAYFPHTGTPTAIVILVNFQDVSFTVSDPTAVFEQYLNGDTQTDYGHGEDKNIGSVKSYFKAMSFGTFEPCFEVVGPVTLSNDMEYYGKNSGSTKDVNIAEMVKEACQLASEKIDFSDSKYDSDNDGNIDLVYVIYAGYGESNGAPENTIWPKSGTGSFGTYGGKSVRRYGVNNELNANASVTSGMFATPKVNGIGLFCHEFSHCLGLPDLYPYSSAARIDNQSMEYWSLMDGGEYVYYGYAPTAYTAWEREVLGWHTISTLDDNCQVTATPVNDGGQSYKMLNPNDTSEYFVMENIQKSGWNKYVPGHGLIVYHVKWPSASVNFNQRPNETAGQPGFALVPADGLLVSSYNDNYTSSEYQAHHKGDPFPGTSGVSELTYSLGLPNFEWYTDGPTVNKELRDIAEDETTGDVTFTYIHDTTSGIAGVSDDNAATTDGRVYSIDGAYMGKDASNVQKGMYIQNGKKHLKK